MKKKEFLNRSVSSHTKIRTEGGVFDLVSVDFKEGRVKAEKRIGSKIKGIDIHFCRVIEFL